MREAIGSSLLLNIALVVIGVISAILIGSVAYSKAYKVKNRIISIIDEYNGDCFSDKDPSCYNRINEELTNMGYSSNISKDCDAIDEKAGANMTNDELKNRGLISIRRVYPKLNESGHKFCVYEYTQCSNINTVYGNSYCINSNQTYYYKVFTFMHFDIPLIGNFLEFDVSGETKSFFGEYINFKN